MQIIPRDYLTIVNINGTNFSFSPANFYLANASLMNPKELTDVIKNRFNKDKLLPWDQTQFENPQELIEKIKKGIKRKHNSLKYWNNDPIIDINENLGIVRAYVQTNRPRNRRDGKAGVPENPHLHISFQNGNYNVFSSTKDFSENQYKNHKFVDLKLSQLILRLSKDENDFVKDLMPFKIENIREGSSIDALINYYVFNQTKFEISKALSSFPIYKNSNNLRQVVLKQKMTYQNDKGYLSQLQKYFKSHKYTFQANVIEFKNTPFETIGQRYSNGENSVSLASLNGLPILIYRNKWTDYLSFDDNLKSIDPESKLSQHPLLLLNQPFQFKDDYNKRLSNVEVYIPKSVSLGDLKPIYLEFLESLDNNQDSIKIIEKIK